ncbi:MAG: heparinase II/III family protein [Chthoniobacteraceae bacterium]
MKIASLLLSLVALTICRAETPPEKSWTSLPLHPRLFADAGRWDGLRGQITADGVSREIYAVVKNTAERLLDLPPVEYVDKGAFWHGPMREAQGRILALAMTYRLSGELRFLRRAKLEMQTLADLPMWYPQHFLDTAEGSLAMAIGLDWLHDDLTSAERTRFEDAIIGKALRSSLEDEAGKTWISGNNNWTAVCHGGLVIAALAVAEREPALAKQIVARALQHLPRYAKLYAPAGAYSEGPDYWAYGTTFYALTAEALRMSFGNTCGLEKAPGFLQTADYTLQMTAPSGLLYNFADNGSELGVEPIMFWFARELRRDDLIQRDRATLAKIAESIASGGERDDASRMLPLALIWRDPSLAPIETKSRSLTWWSRGGSQPQAVLRSAWNDPHATFIGIKAGCAEDSHAHMDVGSFILEASGVRWAVDLGRESYPHARANGIANTELFNTKQDSKRWSIFRCGPESHNLLRFNNAPQLVDARADVTPAHGGFNINLTPVVRDQVRSAQRHFALNPDRSLTIRDTWQTAEAVEVTWQWLTHAKAMKTDHGFRLEQSGESLDLVAAASSKLTFETEDASAPRNKFDSANPGLTRLLIRLHTNIGTDGWLHVTASSR